LLELLGRMLPIEIECNHLPGGMDARICAPCGLNMLALPTELP